MKKRKLRGKDVSNDKRFVSYRRHLKLQGLSKATIQSYERAFRIALQHLGTGLDDLDRERLSQYFDHRLSSKSASTVSIDAAALRFYFRHVIKAPWPGEGLVKAPRAQRLPDIVSLDEVQRIVHGTRCVSYRVFYFTVYSLGLRLSEGLKLQVQDIDAGRHRVHVRRSKGQKDRLVPLSPKTLLVLRRFWSIHRNPCLLFPSRNGGLRCSSMTEHTLDSSALQKALHRVCEDVGIKKTSPRTAYATVTPLI